MLAIKRRCTLGWIWKYFRTKIHQLGFHLVNLPIYHRDAILEENIRDGNFREFLGQILYKSGVDESKIQEDCETAKDSHGILLLGGKVTFGSFQDMWMKISRCVKIGPFQESNQNASRLSPLFWQEAEHRYPTITVVTLESHWKPLNVSNCQCVSYCRFESAAIQTYHLTNWKEDGMRRNCVYDKCI